MVPGRHDSAKWIRCQAERPGAEKGGKGSRTDCTEEHMRPARASGNARGRIFAGAWVPAL